MHKNRWRAFKDSCSKHSPQILTAMAIVEFAATVWLVAKAVPKAERLKKEAEEHKGEELTLVEKAKATWKCYIPAGITGACTVACIVGANSVSTKRNVALGTAYQATEAAFREYKNKVVETIGEKKETLIEDAIGQDEINRHPVKVNEIIDTGQGTTLFRDWASGRDFLHDRTKLEKACVKISQRMQYDDLASLNDLYDEIGLDAIGIGNDYGWSFNRDGPIEPRFTPAEAANGEPCFLFHFDKRPRCGYKW